MQSMLPEIMQMLKVQFPLLEVWFPLLETWFALLRAWSPMCPQAQVKWGSVEVVVQQSPSVISNMIQRQVVQMFVVRA